MGNKFVQSLDEIINLTLKVFDIPTMDSVIQVSQEALDQ